MLVVVSNLLLSLMKHNKTYYILFIIITLLFMLCQCVQEYKITRENSDAIYWGVLTDSVMCAGWRITDRHGVYFWSCWLKSNGVFLRWKKYFWIRERRCLMILKLYIPLFSPWDEMMVEGGSREECWLMIVVDRRYLILLWFIHSIDSIYKIRWNKYNLSFAMTVMMSAYQSHGTPLNGWQTPVTIEHFSWACISLFLLRE